MLCPASAHAQRWQVDVGATSIGYDTASRVAGASVVPQVEWTRRALYALANGNLTVFEGATWTAQASGDVSYLSDPLLDGRIRVEATASVGGSVHADGYRTGSTRAEARAHFTRGPLGAWVGAAAGTGWTSVTRIGAAVGPTAGAWLDRRGLAATLIWTPLHFDGYWFQELNARASASRGPLDLAAYGGWRHAPPASGLDTEGWGGAALSVWVAPRAAVVLSAGSYSSDLLQVLPRGRYASLALRLARQRPPTWTPTWTGRAIHAPAGGSGEMRFRVPDASSVAVAGDWTGWQPVPLERGPDGRWILRLSLKPGVYRFNLIVGGERWMVPEGVATVDDGFGGKAGVLVIP